MLLIELELSVVGEVVTVPEATVIGVPAYLASVTELVGKLKKLTTLPICVGFGVSKPEHAAAIAACGANGVIIGSKIVRIIEENLADKKKMLAQISDFIREIKKAIECQ